MGTGHMRNLPFLRRWRSRQEKDKEYEKRIGVEPNEPREFADLPHYTWEDIRRLEEERVPWLRKRR